MAPDDRISIRENSLYHYDVFDGHKWLGCFKWFKDAAEYAAKQTIQKEIKSDGGTPSITSNKCK